jgi:hypothetical protein
MFLERSVFTIAVGKPLYFRMACALSRSFKFWNDHNVIRFFMATDVERGLLPEDLADIEIIPLKPGQYGPGFSPKLYLDKIAPSQHSLFVDADCLCVGSLADAFVAFRGHSVSVIGRGISSGDWFGDVGAICQQFKIPTMPRFNGGVYYLERGGTCQRVYETARELERRYDEIGFVRLRGHPNDEVLVSLAMALHGQKPIPESGDIMDSLLAGPAGLELDVFSGRALLRNPKKHPKHNPWYELEEMKPKLVHFLGRDIREYPYRQEEMRLELVCGKGWPRWWATVWAKVFFSAPWLIWKKCKDFLRPTYHRHFGARAVRGSRTF